MCLTKTRCQQNNSVSCKFSHKDRSALYNAHFHGCNSVGATESRHAHRSAALAFFFRLTHLNLKVCQCLDFSTCCSDGARVRQKLGLSLSETKNTRQSVRNESICGFVQPTGITAVVTRAKSYTVSLTSYSVWGYRLCEREVSFRTEPTYTYYVCIYIFIFPSQNATHLLVPAS